MIGRKPIISADSPEQGGPSCKLRYFDVAKRGGSPHLEAQRKIGERLLVEALPTSFCSFFLKNFLARILARWTTAPVRPSPPVFSGVWAAAVIHGELLPFDLDL